MNIKTPSEYANYSLKRRLLPLSFIPEFRAKIGEQLYEIRNIFCKNCRNFPLVKEIIALPFGRGWKYKTATEGVKLIIYEQKVLS